MKVTAQVDTSDLRKRMADYARIVGKNVNQELRRHARLACVELANTTQPFGKGKDAQLLGEKAVEVDISKVFYVPTPDGGLVQQLHEQAHKSHTYKRNKTKDQKFDADRATLRFTDRLNGYVASGNMKALQEITKDFGWKYARRTIDPAIHEARRTGRRSKVRKQPGDMTLILNTEKHLQTYINKVKKRVGMAKAGWAVCAEKIPDLGLASSGTRGIPQWVTRNKSAPAPQRSTVDASTTFRQSSNPRVVMRNAVPWTSQNLTESAARTALNIARGKFVKMMDIQIRYVLRTQAKLRAA
jgi:histone H3/H4